MVNHSHAAALWHICNNRTLNTAFYADFRFLFHICPGNLSPCRRNLHTAWLCIHGKIQVRIFLDKFQSKIHILAIHLYYRIFCIIILLPYHIGIFPCIDRNHIGICCVTQDILIGLPIKTLIEVLSYCLIIQIYMAIPEFCLFFQKLLVQDYRHIVCSRDIIIFL